MDPSSVREHAQRAAAHAGVRVEVLHGVHRLEHARTVCDQVWPTVGGGTQVTSNLLTAIDHAGGYVSAAYDLRSGSDEPVAGVISLVGRHHTPQGWVAHLHSHMAAVLDHVRDRGVGTAIKFDQRAWAHEQGIPVIGWTFDPLVRRNAWLNLVKLGARVHEYLPDFYGSMEDALNAHDESDRLYAWWRTDAHVPAAPVAEVLPDEVVVDLPDDIVTLRVADRGAATQWRQRLREQLMPRLQAGWTVRGLTAAGSYVLTPPEAT